MVDARVKLAAIDFNENVNREQCGKKNLGEGAALKVIKNGNSKSINSQRNGLQRKWKYQSLIHLSLIY